MHWYDWLIALPFCFFLGFFGDQATRLLRETWDGVIKADPTTGDIRPVGATLLAQELYAMLDDSIPQTQNAPVTMNSPLTINSPAGTNGLNMNGGTINFGANAQSGDSGGGGPGGIKIGGIEIGPDGITLSDAPINLNGSFYLWNGVPIGLPTTAGTTIFLAQVVSGSGGSYLVNIFGNGSTQPITNPPGPNMPVDLKSKTSGSPVMATIPQFNPLDQLPAGTWIEALHQFVVVTNPPPPAESQTLVTFQFQAPIWLS
jgi:hypothetical protein